MTIAPLVSGLSEAAGNTAVVQVTRSDTTGSLLVNFSVSGTATGSGSDYSYISPAQAFFASGVATADISLAPVNDGTSEPTETVIFTLTPGTGGHTYTIGSPSSATVNLLDNDAQVVTVEQVEDASEDGYEGILRFTRIGNLSSALTVNYTVGGTAAEEDDYEELSGSVTFEAGSATADVNVAAVHDGVYDPDETVVVTVASGSGYSIGAEDEATVMIWDDAKSVFELNSEDGAVWYDIDWSDWDEEDEDPQALSLTNFSLLFAGLTFTEANATITNAVALLEDGEVVDIQFEVEFASPVAGLASGSYTGGEMTGIDATTQQEVGPVAADEKVQSELVIDFSTMAFPASGNVVWQVSGKYGNDQKDDTPVTIPSGGTAEAVAIAMESVLKGKGFEVVRTGTKLSVKGAPGKTLQNVTIVYDAPTTMAGPTAVTVTGTNEVNPPNFFFLKKP